MPKKKTHEKKEKQKNKNENVQEPTLFKRLKANKINNIVETDNRTMCRLCIAFFFTSSDSYVCIYKAFKQFSIYNYSFDKQK